MQYSKSPIVSFLLSCPLFLRTHVGSDLFSTPEMLRLCPLIDEGLSFMSVILFSTTTISIHLVSLISFSHPLFLSTHVCSCLVDTAETPRFCSSYTSVILFSTEQILYLVSSSFSCPLSLRMFIWGACIISCRYIYVWGVDLNVCGAPPQFYVEMVANLSRTS